MCESRKIYWFSVTQWLECFHSTPVALGSSLGWDLTSHHLWHSSNIWQSKRDNSVLQSHFIYITLVKCFEITIITLQLNFFIFSFTYIFLDYPSPMYIPAHCSIPSTNEHFILARCTLHYSTMHFGYFSWIIRLCLMLWQILFCKQHLRKPYQWMLYGWIFWL